MAQSPDCAGRADLKFGIALTPGRLREFTDLGYGYATVDDLAAMRGHGVIPSFIRGMTASSGAKRPSAEELIEMSIHGRL